jgi:hypothetical protein
MENKKQYKNITVILNTLATTKVSFVGFYRRDLEANNWHYYEDEKGDIQHFRKEFMVAVFESDLVDKDL